MRRIKEVLRLKYDCGLPLRQISAALGVSLGAVSKYLAAAEAAGIDAAQARDLDESALEARLAARKPTPASGRIAPDCAFMHREMKRKGVTLQLLWEEYRETHAEAPTYRYTQFCEHYRRYVAGLKRSMRQVHRAGEKLFADFAGPTVPILDPAGGIALRAHVFVAVLGASNYTYACATVSESMADWIGSLSASLTYFGGVPELVVPDNPRAMIAEPDPYEPVANRTAQDFAAHYGTAILPARPRKPQDKAKVEVAVQIVERWILARLRHRRLFSLAELNTAIASLLEDLNRRPFKKLDGNRRDWFERLDAPVLKPLPVTAYELARFKPCRVNIDYHVEIDAHYYSVPHNLVRQQVEARITRSTVEIVFRGRRVASHARSTRRGGFTTVPEHMPAAHRAHREWSPGRLLNWALSVGVATRDLVRRILESKPHPEHGYRACLGLLAASRTYGNARLEAACARALAIGAPTRRCVINILSNKLDEQPLAVQTEFNLPAHDNVRGPDYYH
jgi:transposase